MNQFLKYEADVQVSKSAWVFTRWTKLRSSKKVYELTDKRQFMNNFLGGGFKHCWFSPRKLGKISILTDIFQMGWNHQPDLELQETNNNYIEFPRSPQGSWSSFTVAKTG